MKQGWDQYASQKRIKQKGYLRKYKNRDGSRKTTETSSSNSPECSREEQEEEVKLTATERYFEMLTVPTEAPEIIYGDLRDYGTNVKLVYREPTEEMKARYDPLILADAWITNLKDIQDGKSTSEEDPLTHQERRQGIQGDDQGTERANKVRKGTNKRRCKAKENAKKEVI